MQKLTAAEYAGDGSLSAPQADTLKSGALAFSIPSNVPMRAVGTHQSDAEAEAYRLKVSPAVGPRVSARRALCRDSATTHVDRKFARLAGYQSRGDGVGA